MNARFYIFVGLVSCYNLSHAQFTKPDIPTPAARATLIAKALATLEHRKSLSEELPALVRNPFNPLEEDVVVDTKVAKGRLPGSAKELVAILAGQIAPTGSAERDGERFLLLGQRKVKVGESIPIFFENTQFELEVSAIEGGTFTVRLNREEFTRPIKPAKTP